MNYLTYVIYVLSYTKSIHICLYVYIYTSMCICVCVHIYTHEAGKEHSVRLRGRNHFKVSASKLKFLMLIIQKYYLFYFLLISKFQIQVVPVLKLSVDILMNK